MPDPIGSSGKAKQRIIENEMSCKVSGMIFTRLKAQMGNIKKQSSNSWLTSMEKRAL